MHIQRLTAPTNDPFDISEVRDHARVSFPDDDYELTNKARAAALELENYAQLALLTQTIRLTLDEWPCSDVVALPIAPVLPGATVTVTDNGVAFADFTLRPGKRPELALTGDRPTGLVVIEYAAGFGADRTSVPQDLQLAILDQALAFYDNRAPIDGKTSGISAHMARISARYRRVAV